MNISTKINAEKKLRIHVVEGSININELAKFLKNLYNSDEISPSLNVFWDLRKADFSKVSSSQIRNFTEFIGKNWGIGGKNKAALIVSKDLDYGLSRMYQMLMDNVSQSKISIFKDMDEAEKWIDS